VTLFGKLFGSRSPEESRAAAEALLAEARGLLAVDPKKAGTRLLKLEDRELQPLIDIGGPFHKEAAELVFAVDAAVSREAAVAAPAVDVFTDPEVADWSRLIASARANTQACTHVRFSKDFNGDRCVLPGLEAQWLMGLEAGMAHVVYGEGYTLTRNGLLAIANEETFTPKQRKDVKGLLDAALAQHLDLDSPDHWLSPLGYEMFVYRVG
jgi:hypothetical protein